MSTIYQQEVLDAMADWSKRFPRDLYHMEYDVEVERTVIKLHRKGGITDEFWVIEHEDDHTPRLTSKTTVSSRGGKDFHETAPIAIGDAEAKGELLAKLQAYYYSYYDGGNEVSERQALEGLAYIEGLRYDNILGEIRQDFFRLNTIGAEWQLVRLREQTENVLKDLLETEAISKVVESPVGDEQMVLEICWDRGFKFVQVIDGSVWTVKFAFHHDQDDMLDTMDIFQGDQPVYGSSAENSDSVALLVALLYKFAGLTKSSPYKVWTSIVKAARAPKKGN